MAEKKPDYVTQVQIPEILVTWSKERPGEIDIRFKGGNHAELAASKAILAPVMRDLEESINSEIRGGGTPWRTTSTSTTRTQQREASNAGSVTARGEMEASVEASGGVDSSYVKGGGRVMVGTEGTASRTVTNTDGDSVTINKEAGRAALDKQIVADATVRARLEMLGGLEAWDRNNPNSRTVSYQGLDIKLGGNAIKGALQQEQQKMLEEWGDLGKQIFRGAKGQFDNVREVFEGLKDRANPLKRFMGDASGFGGPDNPYGAMYAANLEAIRGDARLQARLAPGTTPEQLASALTLNASEQKVNPDTRFAFQANERGMVFGQAQGNVADPAAARVSVDANNLVQPTQAQLAQMEATPQPTTQQNRTMTA